MPAGATLQVDLDRGEPETMVSGGIQGDGHAVEVVAHPDDAAAVRLLIQRVAPADG